MREITIIGGGLAGLSLGIGLRERGIPVHLREAAQYPRHRVCGEFINGVSEKTLAALGIEQALQPALRPKQTRWYLGDDKIFEAALGTAAYGISRWKLDQDLAEILVEKGGRLSEGDRVARSELAQEGTVCTNGRQLDRSSEWIGLKAHFSNLPETAHRSGNDRALEMHLGDNCYLGLAPIEDGKFNGCGLFKRQASLKAPPQKLLQTYLAAAGLEQLARDLDAAQMDEASFTGVTGFNFGTQITHSSQPAESKICALGDAERMIPPFTGNGMSMAFESAECALAPLVNYAQGKNSWAACQKEIHRELEARFAKRIRLALRIQSVMMSAGGRRTLGVLGKSGLLPFHWLHKKLT